MSGPDAARPGERRRPGRGDPAPDFDLVGTGGRRYRLSEQRGGAVVVVFYPADGSPVCTRQLRSYSAHVDDWDRLGATVWCLSPQGLDSHEAFARAHDLRMPLLADTDKAVGAAYDVLGPLGFYRRSVFVVGPDGTVVFARRSLSNLSYLPAARLAEAVRSARR